MLRNIPFPYLAEETITRIENAQPAVRTIRLNPRTVAENWRQIEEHKWFLSERLGRDVGPKVAAVDYFDNIYVIVPKTPAPFWERLLMKMDRASELLECDGPNSIANLERMMRGARVR